jgi:transposase
VLRGKEVKDIEELKRQGLSIRAISKLTGFDRKTIRKYLGSRKEHRCMDRGRCGRASWMRSSPISKSD